MGDFTSTNVYVAALLITNGYQLLGTSLNDRGRTKFHFERCPELVKLYEQSRANYEVPIKLSTFVDTMIDLRRYCK